jgi:soluble lytic murein transglycosylase
MTPLARISFVCLAALALSCMRVENTAGNNSAAAPPSAAAASVIVLTPDEQTDGALTRTRQTDRTARDGNAGQLPALTPEEHMRRAAIYQLNRAFDEAREHFQSVITRFPDHPDVPPALFGMGRTLFQERRYEEAIPYFERLGRDYTHTKSGRDGFYYVAATNLRLGRAAEAATRYGEYVSRFPQGEVIENAYLNVIDSWREAGRPDDAIPWVARTRERFRGTPTETNAVFARLRLDVSRGDWQSAINTSDELSRMPFVRGVQTSAQEVAYLRAYSLERLGQREQAIQALQNIPDNAGSYYGALATARLHNLGAAAKRTAEARDARVRAEVRRAAANYPAPYRETILRAARERAVDPRLILSIMRQESGFNPAAKSPAAARGLMQMTVDTASVYAPRVRLTVRENDLYRPEVSILLASEYLAELFRLFPNLPEAVAASYNGGEDNVQRWVRRAVHPDPGVVASEVGFSESKDYVAKVMANYRAYRFLYTEDLRPRR